MGTGDIALPCFECLLKNNEGVLSCDLVGLVTQPDKPVGRKQILTAPVIKDLALAHGVPVLQPENAAATSFLTELELLRPDVIVVMAYGQILTQTLLDMPSLAIINLHASLLPKYRGAACIQAAIDAGDEYTGITVMHVVKSLDAGDIILKKETRIGEQETGGELHDRLAQLAPEALLEALEQLLNGTAGRLAQNKQEASYVPKLMRADGELDWSQSAKAIERRIRAYDPWPGTSTLYHDKKGRARRLKIYPQTTVDEQSGKPGEILAIGEKLKVACGEGSLLLECLQPDGSRKMSAQDFALGNPVAVGDLLGAVR